MTNCVGGLLCAVGILISAASYGQPQRFVQDRFAIGFWVDPPVDEQMEARYAEIAQAHFTLVLGGFGASSPEAAQRQLELCSWFGLRALVFSSGLSGDQLPDGPACWGYLVRDEPSAKDFPDLRKRVDELRAAKPGKLAYINLFPNYANARQLGTDTYFEHVSRFADEVDVDVLSMDHYPVMRPDRDQRDGYLRNLEVMREVSMRKGIPFWNFFNVMPYGPHTDPTEAQLRWQVYTSVAYGAKGVLYFCYWTPRGDEFPKGGAILRADGTRTRHYEQVKRINGELKNLGPTLMRLTSQDVRRITAANEATAVLEGSPLRSLTKADYDPPFDLLIGSFVHEDGRRAVLINNYSYSFTSWPTVEFDAEAEKVVEIDPATGKENALYDESPDLPGMQLSLDAGQGRLFLLP